MNFSALHAEEGPAVEGPGFRASGRCGEGRGVEGARTPGNNFRSCCALQGFAEAQGASAFDAPDLSLHLAMPMNASRTKPSERAARPEIVDRGARPQRPGPRHSTGWRETPAHHRHDILSAKGVDPSGRAERGHMAGETLKGVRLRTPRADVHGLRGREVVAGRAGIGREGRAEAPSRRSA